MKKMKTKIIGITLAVLIIASVFAAMVTPVAALRTARAVDDTDTTADVIVIGELVRFTRATTIQLDADGDGNPDGQVLTADAVTGNIDTADATASGTYIATPAAVATITLTQPVFKISVRDAAGTTEISSVIAGQNVLVVPNTNLPGGNPVVGGVGAGGPNDYVLKIVDVDTPGVNIATGVSLVGGNFQIVTGTGGLAPGDYEIWLATDSTAPEVAAIDLTSTKKTLTVRTAAISVDADLTEQITNNNIVLTITAGVGQTVVVTANGAAGTFTVGKGDVGATEVTGTAGAQTYTDNIPSDGDLTAVLTSTQSGAVTITATIQGTTTTDSIDVQFRKPSTTVSVSTTKFTIGDKVTIEGTTNSGVNQVAIFVADTLQKLADVESDDTYSWEWDTGLTATPKPGSITIKVFEIHPNDVVNAIGSGLSAASGGKGGTTPCQFFDPEVTTLARPADVSTGLLAVAGDLTAAMDTVRVAKEDEIAVTGTAAGESQVRLILIDKDGVVLTDTFESVLEDDSFEWTQPTTTTWDSGTYRVVVISDGRDDYTDLTGGDITGAGATVITGIGPTSNTRLSAAGATLSGSAVTTLTQSQILAKLLDLTTGAGSDDKTIALTFTLEDSYLTIDQIEGVTTLIDNVEIKVTDGSLTINGTTNRVSGTQILVTATSAVDTKHDLPPKTVTVADGKFMANLDASNALEGSVYNVKADDLSEASHELTITVTTAAAPATPEPTEAPAATPTAVATAPPPATPTPTAAPEATPEAPPEAEEPGFEGVFAIAGLLAVAYLVLRIKK